MKKACIILLAIVLVAATYDKKEANLSDNYSYKVVRVLDGDTFIATDGNIQFCVRIVGMDAPEKGYPYADLSRSKLDSMILNKYVSITPTEKGYDYYGRVLGVVRLNGEIVALKIIEEGLAFYYRPACKDYPADKKKYDYDPIEYIRAEQNAAKSKKNLFSDKSNSLPCVYRKKSR